ncbi:MAG: GNAT family N-acetyltransferase [Acidobacteriota bacterium]
MTEILIRPATLEDAEFLVSGNANMALETEGRVLDAHTLRAGVCAVFDDPERGFYLIAEIGGQPAGQMMITYEWSDWRNAAFWWIQSVYTLPGSRGRGVFKALYAHADSLARLRGGVCGLRLYVETHNQRAQSAYLRCGMSEAIYRMFEVDYSIAQS